MKNNSLPGIPLIESPFFAAWLEELRVEDPELVPVAEQLHTQGFAVLRFPDPDFDARAERIKTSLHPLYDWAGHRENPGRGLRLQDAWKTHEDVKSLAVNERVLQILGRLYGRRAIPFQTLNFPVGTQQHYHSDAIHFSSVPERFMCGVWVALEDIDETAGPLEYYVGTHQWPIYTNEHTGRSYVPGQKVSQEVYHNAWQDLVARTQPQKQTFTARKGDALIWCANLLHGGAPQTNPDRTRWSQVTHYYFENCVYYTPMLSEPFKGLIHYRQITDVTTGNPVPNICNGQVVDPKFIEQSIVRGRESLLPEKEFDAEYYLQENPDVAGAGVAAYEHYKEHGIREGRPGVRKRQGSIPGRVAQLLSLGRRTE
jgi:hypothetical protein